MNGNKVMTFGLRVISVNGIFYDDRAEEIILPCADGELAVLANHEEMILALSDGVIKIKKPGGEWLYGVVSLGSVQVANNRCIVLVNTVEKPEDIDISYCLSRLFSLSFSSGFFFFSGVFIVFKRQAAFTQYGKHNAVFKRIKRFSANIYSNNSVNIIVDSYRKIHFRCIAEIFC